MTEDQDRIAGQEELKKVELRLREYADDLFRERYYGPIKDEISSNMIGWLRSRYSFLLVFVGLLGFGGTAFVIDNATTATVRTELTEHKETIEGIVKASARLDARIDEINRAIAKLNRVSNQIEDKLAEASTTSEALSQQLGEAGKVADSLEIDLKGIKQEIVASSKVLADSIEVAAIAVEKRIGDQMKANARDVDDLIAATTLDFENRLQKK